MQNQLYFYILAKKMKTHVNKMYNYSKKKNPATHLVVNLKLCKTYIAYKLKTTVKEIKEHLNELEDRLC